MSARRRKRPGLPKTFSDPTVTPEQIRAAMEDDSEERRLGFCTPVTMRHLLQQCGS